MRQKREFYISTLVCGGKVTALRGYFFIHDTENLTQTAPNGRTDDAFDHRHPFNQEEGFWHLNPFLPQARTFPRCYNPQLHILSRFSVRKGSWQPGQVPWRCVRLLKAFQWGFGEHRRPTKELTEPQKLLFLKMGGVEAGREPIASARQEYFDGELSWRVSPLPFRKGENRPDALFCPGNRL